MKYIWRIRKVDRFRNLQTNTTSYPLRFNKTHLQTLNAIFLYKHFGNINTLHGFKQKFAYGLKCHGSNSELQKIKALKG